MSAQTEIGAGAAPAAAMEMSAEEAGADASDTDVIRALEQELGVEGIVNVFRASLALAKRAAAKARTEGTPAPAPIPADEVREALVDVLREYDRNTCQHDETHRGGHIWTICDGCGRKWADDEGGFQPYVDPPVIAKARSLSAALARSSASGEGLRSLLVEARSGLHAYTGGKDGACARTIARIDAALSRPDTAGEERRPTTATLTRWLTDHAMLSRVPAEFAARALLERDDSPLRASPSPDTAGDGEGWLPISMAPKDGTVVDLSKDGARFTDFRWDAEQRGGGAWSRAAHEHRHWRDRVAIYAPDHWMARPAMPEAPSDPRLDRAAPSSHGEG